MDKLTAFVKDALTERPMREAKQKEIAEEIDQLKEANAKAEAELNAIKGASE